MKKLKKALSVLLAVLTLVSVFAVTAVPVSAANYTTNYAAFNQPESNDFARWNGSRMIKGSNTVKAEVQWIQAALNFAIKNLGLKANLLDVDGSFGPETRKTTLAFQKAYGLAQDGSFGPACIAKMKALLAKPVTPPSSTAKPAGFVQKNIIQYGTSKSSSYISGNWYSQTSYKGNPNNIGNAGCGIVALVSAIYNLGGTMTEQEVSSAITSIFKWAYTNNHWVDLTNWSLYEKVESAYGSRYGFSIGPQHGKKHSENTDLSQLVEHLKTGNTAVVHVYGHFMAAVGCRVNAKGNLEIHIFDPSPGGRRAGCSSKKGDWIEISKLQRDGGKKDQDYNQTVRWENMEIDAYWLVSKK